jgi:hypothetical protein
MAGSTISVDSITFFLAIHSSRILATSYANFASQSSFVFA